MRHEWGFVGGLTAHLNKSKMVAATIFNFRKISITPDWIKISAPNFMGRCITAMQRWPRDQKSKPEVNSRDVIKWMSEVYVRRSQWLTDIWTKFGTEHTYHTIKTREWPNSHKLKIQDGGSRHLEFQKKMSITLTCIKTSCIKLYEKMHYGRWPADQKSKPEVNLRDVIKWMSGA